MANYKKKYITLRDAAIISGYTTTELKNFCKIGLVPHRKRKNRLYIRFDAFEKLNEVGEKEKATQTTKKAASNNKKPTKMKGSQSLIPFKTPHRALVKVLEPVAFTAAVAMVLYVSLIPTVAQKIVFGVDVAESSLVYIGNTVEDLFTSSAALPVNVVVKVANMKTLKSSEVAPEFAAARVAGVSTVQTRGSSTPADLEQQVSNPAGISKALIGIADASESFESSLQNLTQKTHRAIVEKLRFENMDSGITNFFRL